MGFEPLYPVRNVKPRATGQKAGACDVHILRIFPLQSLLGVFVRPSNRLLWLDRYQFERVPVYKLSSTTHSHGSMAHVLGRLERHYIHVHFSQPIKCRQSGMLLAIGWLPDVQHDRSRKSNHNDHLTLSVSNLRPTRRVQRSLPDIKKPVQRKHGRILHHRARQPRRYKLPIPPPGCIPA